MANIQTICLLTAGLGSRMGKYASIINKSLLPVQDKAIISHIIEQFDCTDKFVVAIGYKGDQVKTYLKLAHPNINFTFVEVFNFAGPGSGPAHSLSCCRPYIDGSFTAITCDGLYDGANPYGWGHNGMNSLGVSRVTPEESPAYCNVVVDRSGVITQIIDKRYCESGLALNGVYTIYDTEQFWENLNGTELSSGFAGLDLVAHRIDWIDLGTYERYRKHMEIPGQFDFSKTDEFIYIVNDCVIKFFRDGQITANRVKKAENKSFFPPIFYSDANWYAYEFINGETLYQCGTVPIFESLLHWLERDVWPDVPINAALTSQMCEKFYHTKTLERLQQFREKYPTFNPRKINGKVVNIDIDTALNLLPWSRICNEQLDRRTCFMHGDLQFDNILYSDGVFSLIDWRQDFAGMTEFGDLYYDLGKMVAGLTVNLDYIKRNLFFYEESDSEVNFHFSVRSSHTIMLDQLRQKYPSPLIDIITTLIFLNMAPMHGPNFDKLMFCLALERLNSQV